MALRGLRLHAVSLAQPGAVGTSENRRRLAGDQIAVCVFAMIADQDDTRNDRLIQRTHVEESHLHSHLFCCDVLLLNSFTVVIPYCPYPSNILSLVFAYVKYGGIFRCG